MYAGILGLSILYTYAIKRKLFNVKFYNKKTNEQIEASYSVIFNYVIGNNYIFFSSIVLLLTMGITLIFFSIYHLNLIRLNLTTSEKIKRDKMIGYMEVVRETMRRLYNSNEYKDADQKNTKNFQEEFKLIEKSVKLSSEDINKFDNIVFKGEIF